MEEKEHIDWEEELEKCKESPYYFATNYMTVDGKPFTTHYSEREFNEIVNCRGLNYNGRLLKRRMKL